MKQEIAEGTINNTRKISSIEDESLDLKELLNVLSQVKNGKLNVRMPVTQAGIHGRICEVLNEIIDMNEQLVTEITTAEKIISKIFFI